MTALADWRTETGKDVHTLAVDPQFLNSTTNLHVANVTSPIVRAGTPLAAVTDDIDGDTGLRSSQPVIGCDEFVTYSDSVELCGTSGARLVTAGQDHRLNCEEGRRALEEALGWTRHLAF